MSEVIISNLAERPEKFEQVMEIFFEASTKKDFASMEERVRFLVKYLGVYVQSVPELCLIALQDDQVVGYCCGMHSTPAELYEQVPHLEIFEDQFEKYGAHLHINCSAASRGQGIGQKLVAEFEDLMRQEGAEGIHIITSPTARNVHFYKKLHYDHEVLREFNKIPLLLLGKTL